MISARVFCVLILIALATAREKINKKSKKRLRIKKSRKIRKIIKFYKKVLGVFCLEKKNSKEKIFKNCVK